MVQIFLHHLLQSSVVSMISTRGVPPGGSHGGADLFDSQCVVNIHTTHEIFFGLTPHHHPHGNSSLAFETPSPLEFVRFRKIHKTRHPFVAHQVLIDIVQFVWLYELHVMQRWVIQ